MVPGNLKSGVTKPCRYEPDINPTYQEMASHYGIAVIPARVRKPKDKAKVENGVQVVERRILAKLRNRQFFSLSELNEAIGELLEELNNRPFQKIPGSRLSMFNEIEKPALRALPQTPYAYAEWKKAGVNIDYHVEVDGHYYSVPHALMKQRLDVRITSSTILRHSTKANVWQATQEASGRELIPQYRNICPSLTGSIASGHRPG